VTDLKNIHIGKFVETRWKESNISFERTCNFFKLDREIILEMFQQNSLDTSCLLSWSKLLDYDFFRLYSQHLILYSPPINASYNNLEKKENTSLPMFRKNIYTQEIIAFIIELIETGEKTRQQVIEEYRIPKTTLYKWIYKYKNKI
jgi:hypothetical protein